MFKKTLVKILISVYALACVLAFTSTLEAHSGGLDENGGHVNKKTGEYHLHRQSQQKDSKPDRTSRSKSASGNSATIEPGRVVGIMDGDTLAVINSAGQQIKIRVHGIDAPESAQAFGSAAKKRASDLLFGRTVSIQEIEKDRYGRVVARVTLEDGRDFGAEMLRAGMAWHYKQYAPNENSYATSEDAARKSKVGLWQDASPIPPWEWRKVKKAK